MTTIKIGTRGSPLALWQAEWVRSRIMDRHMGVNVELTIIHTQGDKILDSPLALIGGKGLFVKEIETALLEGTVHIAVHSMKDVPTALPDGLFIASICEREDPRDAFVGRTVKTVAELPHGAKVGTSSLRRQTQLLHKRPDIQITPLRGNVGTRLRKLESENLDSIILAVAGLKRMEQDNLITEYMSVADSLPAVAQGAVGVEARIGDRETLDIISFLDDPVTRVAVEAERAFLKRLEGGCQVPIAGHAAINDGLVTLDGLVGAVDGSVIYRETMRAHVGEQESLGTRLAETLLNRGAEALLKEAYKSR